MSQERTVAQLAKDIHKIDKEIGHFVSACNHILEVIDTTNSSRLLLIKEQIPELLEALEY